MTSPAFRSAPAPAGLTAYTVTVDDVELGTVERRRGGWWRAWRADNTLAGSWHATRAEAAAALTVTPPR